MSPDNREFTLRIGPAVCLPGLARSFGCDPAPALAAAGLDKRLFSNPENRVSIKQMGRFGAEIARLIKRPDLGLLIARNYGPHSLGPILPLAREGPNVRTALLNITRLLKHHNECAYLSLSEVGSDAILAYELRDAEFEGADIVLATAIGNAFRVMRQLCGEGWCPAEVRLSMGRPKIWAPYEAFFSAPIRFGSTMDALVFPLYWLDQRVAPEPSNGGGNSLPPASWDFSDQVRHQIVMRIGNEPVTAQSIAAAMGLSRRTFDRQLSVAGVSFARMVDEIRYARARRLLTAGHTRLSDISLHLVIQSLVPSRGHSADGQDARHRNGDASMARAARHKPNGLTKGYFSLTVSRIGSNC